jgi:N-acetylneuraminate synthase/N,N'-diacetyllegionaminate synthase
MEIRVKHKTIGGEHPVFIVAEIGTNHNGKLELALEMVERAKELGVDAVKFQPVAPWASYIEGTDAHAIYSKTWLESGAWEKIKERAERCNLIFFAAPADLPGAEMMRKLQIPLVKISSPSMTNVPLQDAVAGYGVPVMVSTGMSYVGEVEKVILRLNARGVKEIILLHCVSIYPSPAECLNLKAIQTMIRVFPYPIGYSDHSLGNTACLAAVALGAKVIEKHFTLDKNMEGPDHHLSADFHDFRALVAGIRNIEKALGTGVKAPCELEKEKREVYRRCLVANCEISKGTTIRPEMVGLKRPTGKRGLDTDFYYEVIGRKAVKDIKKDEAIGLEHI